MSERMTRLIYFNRDDKLKFLNILRTYKRAYGVRDFAELSIGEKQTMWDKIHADYNASSPSTGLRTICQLKSLYKNMKRKVRNDALHELETFKKEQCASMPQTSAAELVNKINKKYNLPGESAENGSRYRVFVHAADSPSNLREFQVAGDSTTTVGDILSEKTGVEEILVEPAVTIDLINDSICDTRRGLTTNLKSLLCSALVEPPKRPKLIRRPSTDSPKRRRLRFPSEKTRLKKLKLRMLKVEYEAKKREATLNLEIANLRKEIAVKCRENALRLKTEKVEEIQQKEALRKLQQENEMLKQKLLKADLSKAQKLFINSLGNEF